MLTGAEKLLCDLVGMACGFDEKMCFAFAQDFFGNKLKRWGNVRETIQMNGKEVTHVNDFDLFFEVHAAYFAACEKWRISIEKRVKKPLEEHCHAYTTSPFDFLAVLGYLIDRNDNFNLEQFCKDFAHTKAIQIDKNVEAAARGVQNGWDLARKKCWECGQENEKVYKCSKCCAARYCSKECQRTSWKSGHKEACADLKTMYEAFTTNHCRIDHALKLQAEKSETPMVDGCALSVAGTKDYMLLPLMLTEKMFPVRFNIDIVRDGGVSIDHMYKSLGEIVSGCHHWMFEDTFPSTLQEYLDSHILERATKYEMDYMIQGLLFLAVDLSKISPVFAIPVVVNQFKEHLRKTSLNGELMPVTRFIEIYYRFGLAEREGYEDPATRLKSLAQCFTIMINCFHKKTSEFDMETLTKIAEGIRGRSCEYIMH